MTRNLTHHKPGEVAALARLLPSRRVADTEIRGRWVKVIERLIPISSRQGAANAQRTES